MRADRYNFVVFVEISSNSAGVVELGAAQVAKIDGHRACNEGASDAHRTASISVERLENPTGAVNSR